eukprot:m.110372 g.110372  ORF g.110372 m.110372 type:complete len:62 (+) comp12883_c0_seq3:9308-9493(+)
MPQINVVSLSTEAQVLVSNDFKTKRKTESRASRLSLRPNLQTLPAELMALSTNRTNVTTGM